LTPKEVAAWFDPSPKRWIFPKFRRAIEYLKTILMLESDLQTKARALNLWVKRVASLIFRFTLFRSCGCFEKIHFKPKNDV
jgi:hypothetical protein